MTNLIGLSGQKQSGKDTVAGMIQKWFRMSPHKNHWQRKQFAGKLKEICALLTGTEREDWEVEDFKREDCKKFTRKGERITNRELLQYMGTDLLRDQLDREVWLKALFADYKRDPKNYLYGKGIYDVTEADEVMSVIEKPLPNWIITDCRFENEANAIQSRNGIIIRINRTKTETDTHASETGLDGYNFDYYLDNNGTLDELQENVNHLMKRIFG